MADVRFFLSRTPTNETKEEHLNQGAQTNSSGPKEGTHVGYEDVLHRSDTPLSVLEPVESVESADHIEPAGSPEHGATLDSTEPDRTSPMNRAALNPVEGPALAPTLIKPSAPPAQGDTQGQPQAPTMPHGAPQLLVRGTAPSPPPVQELPVTVVPHNPPAATPQVAANATPTLRDVGSTFSRWAAGRIGGTAGWFVRHAAMFTVFIAVGLAATLGITIASARFARLPEDDQVRADASASLAPPTPTVGIWDSDEPLRLTAADITEKATDSSNPDICVVSVRATFSNSSISTLTTGRLSYKREDDAWTCTDTITENDVSYRATTGVNGERAADFFINILQRADETSENETSYESPSLASLFDGSEVSVTGEGYDDGEQTSAVALHLTHATSFVSRECDLSANFAFVPASGSWELHEVYVSGSPYDLNYAPILGTWYGTFLRQTTRDGKCLAAADNGLALNIEQVEPDAEGNLCISGTLSGIAHFHSSKNKDKDSDKDDIWLDEVSFTGTADNSASGIAFDCEARDLAEGKAELRLEFGRPSAPDAATATLTTSHDYEEQLWIFSYPSTARFADEFSLEKAA